LLTHLFERSNPTIVPGGDTIRVAALLDEGERRVDALSSQPALQARMWRVLGNMHAARSRFDRAKTLLQRAYETQQRVAGPNDSTAAAIYLELARAVGEYSGPDAARPMFDSSIAKLRRSLGAGHADVAIGLEERAVLETDSSRRRALMDSAKRIRVETKTVDSMSMAGTYNREGSDQWSRGHWSLAYAYFDSSLRVLEKLLPPDHANRLHVMHNVASALTKLREWDRADSVHHLLLDAQRRSLGTNSVEYANTLESYSLSRAERGRYAEAEADLRISLATFRQLVGPTHWHTPNTLRNLGIILIADGKADVGLALLDTALSLTRAINGDTSTSVGYINGQLSHIYLVVGRPDDAHQSALIAERLLGPRLAENDSRRSDLEFWLGLDAFARGDTTAAVGHFTTARDGYARLMAPDDDSVVRATCMLGVALVSAGRVDAGARPLREACPRQAVGAFPSPVITRWAREALARLRP
jgi:tetratricopeptide (TPR) repeat protein